MVCDRQIDKRDAYRDFEDTGCVQQPQIKIKAGFGSRQLKLSMISDFSGSFACFSPSFHEFCIWSCHS